MSDALSASFSAVLKRVASNSAGGFTVAFDLPDIEAKAAAKLMSEFSGSLLTVAVVVNPDKADF